MGESDWVQVEARDRIGVIRLNRPDKLNATTTAMVHRIAEGMRAFEEDDDIRAIVICGSGRSFSAGRDLKEIGEFHGQSVEGTRAGMEPLIGLFGAFNNSNKVTVSVVQGHVVAFGACIAAYTDLTIAERGAVFSMAEARRGLATLAPQPALIQTLPHKVMMEMVLTGDYIDAERAYSIGFVNRLVEPGTGFDAAMEWVGSFIENDTGYVRDTKAALRIARELTHDQAMEFLIGRSVLHHISGAASSGIAHFVGGQGEERTT